MGTTQRNALEKRHKYEWDNAKKFLQDTLPPKSLWGCKAFQEVNNKTIEVVLKLPKKKLDQIKKKEGKKGLSDRAYILLAIDEYLNPITESHIIWRSR